MEDDMTLEAGSQPIVSDAPATEPVSEEVPQLQPTTPPPAPTTAPVEQKKPSMKLAKSFLDKIRKKNVLTKNEANTVSNMAEQAGLEQGKQIGMQQVLNPNNVAVKKNNYKQSIVAGLSAGPSGGMQ